MDIRGYSPADRAAVIALWHATGLVALGKNDPEADIDLCVRSPSSELLVGLDGDKIVAAMMLGHDGHRGWIYYLAVTSNLQRQGIGRQMVAHAEAWHRQRGIPKCQLMIRDTNTAVAGFYAALGYQNIPRVVMQKVL